MQQIDAEYGLLISLAINAALLLFIAGVLRKAMNDMSEATFRGFVVSLVRHSTRSPFMVIGLNLPAIGAIPYFYRYGSGNRWIVAGVACWLGTGLIAKVYKMPVYQRIGALRSSDLSGLQTERNRLNAANAFQAGLNCVATALAAMSFVR